MDDSFMIQPIGHVHNDRPQTGDDYWGGVVSEIRLNEDLPVDCLDGIEEFSHLEILFYFHLMDEGRIVAGARQPRNNPALPKVGIFAQRAKFRPNRLGLTTVTFRRREGRSLWVEGLDAIAGTPIIDIKPVFAQFLPRGPVVEPEWTHAIMARYWADYRQKPK